MKRTLGKMIGYRLAAVDGEIGKIHDFFIDDDVWVLRYLVVETGKWLSCRQVLVAPSSVEGVDPARRVLKTTLTRRQVLTSLDAGLNKPISKQREVHHTPYLSWDGDALVMLDPTPSPVPPNELPADPHLRSVREISSYRLIHRDECIARVGDFIVDDSDGSVPLMIVEHGSWLRRRDAVLPVESVSSVSWLDSAVTTGLTKTDLERLTPERELLALQVH